VTCDVDHGLLALVGALRSWSVLIERFLDGIESSIEWLASAFRQRQQDVRIPGAVQPERLVSVEITRAHVEPC